MKRMSALLLGGLLLFAGSVHADQTTTAFPDPSRPGVIKIVNGEGNITVTGHDGKDVVIDTGNEVFMEPSEANERARGLRRIAGTGMNVTANEDANIIEVVRSLSDNVNITIQVPVNTSIYIGGGVMSGNIDITGVSGKIEVKTLDGNVTLEQISGSVTINTLDGDILAAIDRVDSDKPLSFSTMDGDVDVTLPSSIKATVKFSTMDGGIYTDFDVKRDASGASKEQEKALKKLLKAQEEAAGKAEENAPDIIINNDNTGFTIPIPMPQVSMDLNLNIPGLPQTTFYGTIGGGGQYIQISTMDGDIYFRKNK